MSIAVGIDVSKAKLDVALLNPQGKFRSKVFSNDQSGFKALLLWLNAQVSDGYAGAHVCMEATGAYHEGLALFLHDQGAMVSVVNPLLVKRFAEANMVRNKTDDGDAKCLARFCQVQRPDRWDAPTPGVRALQALVGRLQTLQQMRQAECNRLDVAHESVRGSIVNLIAELDAEIAQVRRQIEKTIDDDPDLKRRNELLQTVPGLGDKTIPQLLAYIGRPERFKSVKALIAYAKLAPMIRQSGTSLNKHRGTHPMGHTALKQALYFPAMVAGRFNPLVAAFWARLKSQNKPGKLIVEACMHKLLAIAYGVLRSGKPFEANHPKPEGA
jgi:transposase